MPERSWAETSAALPDGSVPGASQRGAVDGMFFSCSKFRGEKNPTTVDVIKIL